MHNLSSFKKHLPAICILAGIVVITGAVSLRGQLTERVVAEIGIEHLLPVTVSVQMTSIDDATLVDVHVEATETVFLSLPANWKRGEVRDAPLSDVTDEPPALGFTRWAFPPGATISYTVSGTIDQFRFHNPSLQYAKVEVSRVNIETNEVERDAVIMTSETVEL